MRLLNLFLLLLLPLFALSQGDRQSINLDGATEVRVYAAFSSVKLITGGTNALAVRHNLLIDGVDHADLRHLVVERSNGVLYLREVKPTANSLQKEIPPVYGNQIADSRALVKGNFNGVIVDAILEIEVPAGLKITVETEYGGINAVNVAGLVSARARYGAIEVIYTQVAPLPAIDLYSNYGSVDLTIPASRGANLDLATSYGDLFTDLNITIDKATSQEKEFYQRLVGTISGGGGQIKCEAPYGDIYLREG